MRKILFTLLLLSSLVSNAQIICVFCYNQNDSISSNVTNYIQNGSFEYGCPLGGYFIPNSINYDCNLTGWTGSGGASSTYASVWDSTIPASQTPDGMFVAYFGNGVFARVCSAQYFDTTCFGDSGCVSTSIQPGYPYNDTAYGGPNGPSIEQTVNNLIVGNTYILEFWAGGEGQSNGWMDRGLFGVDVGFGYTFLRNKPTSPGYIGTRFIIEFNATSTSHTIKFTNWGHICGTCTELILDDVRLYPLADLSPVVPPCAGATITAMFTADNHLCPGTCTEFTNLSTNATNYVWSFPGGTPSVSTDPNPTNICYLNSGNYSVQLIASNGSGGADTLFLPNYITVYPAPPPQGIMQNGDTLLANVGSASYQWFFNGNIIPGATNYFYVAPQSGNYSVVAADENQCEVEAVINNVVAGIEQTAFRNQQMSLYPNPVSEKLYVNSYSLFGTAATEISVYNVMGEKIYSAPYHEEMTIDCKSFPSGIYFLEMTSSEKSIRTKFVKQ